MPRNSEKPYLFSQQKVHTPTRSHPFLHNHTQHAQRTEIYPVSTRVKNMIFKNHFHHTMTKKKNGMTDLTLRMA